MRPSGSARVNRGVGIDGHSVIEHGTHVGSSLVAGAEGGTGRRTGGRAGGLQGTARGAVTGSAFAGLGGFGLFVGACCGLHDWWPAGTSVVRRTTGDRGNTEVGQQLDGDHRRVAEPARPATPSSGARAFGTTDCVTRQSGPEARYTVSVADKGRVVLVDVTARNSIRETTERTEGVGRSRLPRASCRFSATVVRSRLTNTGRPGFVHVVDCTVSTDTHDVTIAAGAVVKVTGGPALAAGRGSIGLRLRAGLRIQLW